MLGDDALQFLLNRCILLAAPVDGQGHLILMIVQFAGSITREFEDGRPAHAPVGDKQWPRRLEVRTGDIGGRRFHHCPHQAAQCLVGDGKCKE